MWTVANIIDRFSNRFEFFVLTRNYDSPGDTTPYTSVETDAWNNVGNARVYYASTQNLTKKGIAVIVNEVRPDCIFLNSVFGTTVVKFLLARRRGMVADIPIVLASTGNLGTGGMATRRLKKKLFLAYAKIIGLYRGVIWKSSTKHEVAEARLVFGNDIVTMIAPDLTPTSLLPEYSFDSKPKKNPGSARFIFLSRVVPKKNLLFLLKCLVNILHGDVVLDIVGPHEEADYWSKCLSIIGKLPQNIKVNVLGGVSYLEGLDLLCNSQFFVLPTLNENFGYVFVESMAAGCPVLTTDQTVWNDMVSKIAGWIIPLSCADDWVDTIRQCIDMDADQYAEMSASARNFAEEWLRDTRIEDATLNVFNYALNSGANSAENGG